MVPWVSRAFHPVSSSVDSTLKTQETPVWLPAQIPCRGGQFMEAEVLLLPQTKPVEVDTPGTC